MMKLRRLPSTERNAEARFFDAWPIKRLPAASWLRLACSSAGAVIAAAIILISAPAVSPDKEEAKRLSTFWSGYVTAYAELHGSLDGLQEQIAREAEGQDPLVPYRLRLRDDAGVILAELGDAEGGTTSVKPFVLDGVVAGTAEAAVSGERPWSTGLIMDALLGSAAAFGMLYGSMSLQARLSRRRLRYWAGQASLLQPREGSSAVMPPIATAAILSRPAEPGEDELARQLAIASAYIAQLQTVRKSMVAEVAHELRTPLSVLIASIDNALYEGRPLEAESLAALSEQARGMARLVQDLQDLSLAESGRLTLDKHWFYPAQAAEAIAGLLEAEAEDRGIEIKTELDGTASIFGDEKRIRQLILNLAGNALRHARTKVTLTVAAADGSLRIQVSDDGWGLEEEELQQLFNRFYRKSVYADGSPVPRGHGLGLAIVKGIAEAHGGIAGASSIFGEGASFYAELPLFRD